MKSVTFVISLLILNSCDAQQVRILEGQEHPNEFTYQQPTLPSQAVVSEDQVIQGLSQNSPVVPTIPTQEDVQNQVANAAALYTPDTPSVPTIPSQEDVQNQAAALAAQYTPEVPTAPTIPTQEDVQNQVANAAAQYTPEVPAVPTISSQADVQNQAAALAAQYTPEVPAVPTIPSQADVQNQVANAAAQYTPEVPSVPTIPSQADVQNQAAALAAQYTPEVPAIPSEADVINHNTEAAQQEQASVQERLRETIANRKINEEDLDSILDSTLSSIPGLDEQTQAEYKSQAKEQYNSMSKEDWMKALGGFAAATGLTCFGCCAMCKESDEEKQYNEQNDEIEVQQTNDYGGEMEE